MKKSLLCFALVASLSSPATMANGMDHATMDHSKMKMPSRVGMPVPAAMAKKTIAVTIENNQFKFDNLDIKNGDVVKFVITNKDAISHNFSVGSIDEQARMHKMMKSMPNMDHKMTTSITVAAGKTVKFAWHFMGEKFVEFACHKNDIQMNYILQ